MSKLINIIGQTFSNWTVISGYTRKGNATLWECRCFCGNIKKVSGDALRNGRSKSCSFCRIKKFSQFRKTPKQYFRKEETGLNRVFRQYKNNCKKKGREFSLTKLEFEQLITANCFYCNTPPTNVIKGNSIHCKDFFYNGIDRVNNFLSYTKENSVTCCETCNRAKLSQNIEDFKAWIIKVL